MKAISLFSGIGAFELAAQMVFGDNYQTFQFVEIDVNAHRVLRSHFPNIPIWCDIRSYHPGKPRSVARRCEEQGKSIRFPTVVVGGFPCTNTSSAGKREGLSGNESNLWWEMYRIILESEADFVVIENPEGIIHRGLRAILGALRMGGYEREIEIISAAELGAPHQRNRLFIIAYPYDLSLQQRQGWKCWSESIRDDIAIAKQTFSYPQTQPGSVLLDARVPRWLDGISFNGWWRSHQPPIEPGIAPRTAGRRECINLYGRSIVPLQAVVAMMRVRFLVGLME